MIGQLSFFMGVLVLTDSQSTTGLPPSLAESLLHLVMVDGTRNVNQEPPDQRIWYKVCMYLCLWKQFWYFHFYYETYKTDHLLARLSSRSASCHFIPPRPCIIVLCITIYLHSIVLYTLHTLVL